MTAPTAPKPADPLALLRTRCYLALLVFAAILGVPIAATGPAPVPRETSPTQGTVPPA